MIKYEYFFVYVLNELLEQVSAEINERKIININKKEKIEHVNGYDEYDSWTETVYMLDVFYRD